MTFMPMRRSFVMAFSCFDILSLHLLNDESVKRFISFETPESIFVSKFFASRS
jgi:hypothetical protein